MTTGTMRDARRRVRPAMLGAILAACVLPMPPMAGAQAVAVDGDDPNVACYAGIRASVNTGVAIDDAASRLCRDALRGTERDAPGTVQHARSLTHVGLIAYQRRQYDQALRHFRQAAAIVEKREGSDSEPYAAALDNIAAAEGSSGRDELAERNYRQALEIREKRLGASHPDVASTLTNLALVLGRQRKFDPAAEALERAIAIHEVQAPTSTALADALMNLAWVRTSRSQWSEARPLVERALSIDEAALGADHPDTVGARRDLQRIDRRLAAQAAR